MAQGGPRLLESRDKLVNELTKVINGNNEVGFYIGGTNVGPSGVARNPHGQLYQSAIKDGTLRKIDTFYIETTQEQGSVKRELIDQFIENGKCMNGRRGEGRMYRFVYVTISAIFNYKHQCHLCPDRQTFGSVFEFLTHFREHDTDPDGDELNIDDI